MATNPSPSDYRAQLAALTRLAGRDLDLLMAEVSGFARRDVALRAALPLLIDTYGQAAAALSADWYDSYRLSLNVPGNFTASPAGLPDGQDSLSLINWARATAKTPDSMIDLVYGGMQRRVATQARLTVMGAAVRDKGSTGWMRIGDGKNCAFCDLLISRGAVYKENTVRFGAHDHCNCQAAPSWGRWSDATEVDQYRQTERRRSEDTKTADDERAKAWIAENLVG